jgi:RNA polymerase sigma-70 factor (ECF subfamily)
MSSTHSPHTVQTDRELAEAASAGDALAFTELVDRHTERMERLAQRYMRSHTDAQDAVQDALLNAWTHVPRFRGDAAFGSWLHRITANACLMAIRRRKRRPEMPVDDAVNDLPEPSCRHPHALLEMEELGHVLRSAIADLPPHYREVFELAHVHYTTMADIAKQTGLTVPNVKTRLHRARLKLRHALSEYLDAA